MRAFYQGTVPSYAVSYDALGDQEAFTLKYVWELSVYFPFYVFPFINDLFTDRRFLMTYLGEVRPPGAAQPRRAGVRQRFLPVEEAPRPAAGRGRCSTTSPSSPRSRPRNRRSTAIGPSPEEAARLLDRHLANLDELARFIAAHIASVVVGDRAVLTNARFVREIDVTDLRFDPEEMRARWSVCAGSAGRCIAWSFDPFVLDRFRRRRPARLRSTALPRGRCAVFDHAPASRARLQPHACGRRLRRRVSRATCRRSFAGRTT